MGELLLALLYERRLDSNLLFCEEIWSSLQDELEVHERRMRGRNLYTFQFKNWEIDKEAPLNFCPERGALPLGRRELGREFWGKADAVKTQLFNSFRYTLYDFHSRFVYLNLTYGISAACDWVIA